MESTLLAQTLTSNLISPSLRLSYLSLINNLNPIFRKVCVFTFGCLLKLFSATNVSLHI